MRVWHTEKNPPKETLGGYVNADQCGTAKRGMMLFCKRSR